MVKTNVKRVLAIAVAVILLVGTCFTGVVSATAAGLADGLDEVATKALDACTRTGKPPEITDITGGGVKIKYKADNGINADHPYATTKMRAVFSATLLPCNLMLTNLQALQQQLRVIENSR